jgi:hypothetical protein
MTALNLPPFEHKLKKAEGKFWIFDVLRKKYMVLTPEEWVRQHFVHYLMTELKYPRSLIKVEGGLSYNQLQKRSDIVVFDRAGKPWMLIECKSPDETVGDNTLRQASVYNKTLGANYLVVTNGLKHLCYRIHWTESRTEALSVLPAFE